MSFFRSEKMFLFQMILHTESAFDCILELGYAGKAHFINIFDGFVVQNMKYANELQRCTDAERAILRLQEEVNKMGMRIFYYPNIDKEEIPMEKDLQKIETTLESIETELNDINSRCEQLRNRKEELSEHQIVLQKMQYFLTGAFNTEAQITHHDSMMFDLLQDTTNRGLRAEEGSGPLYMLTGAVPIARFTAFEVMVWRVSRGNAYMKHAEFVVPPDIALRQNLPRYKYAFLIVFLGKELHTKLSKVCQGFQAKLYSCEETENSRKAQLKSIADELADLEVIFKRTCELKKRVLGVATADMFIWYSKIHKLYNVYFVLNRMSSVRLLRQMSNRYLQAEVWIAKHDVRAVRAALMKGARAAAQNDPAQVFPPMLIERKNIRDLKEPTYFRTNKFTKGFQNLIDSYGVANYRELNPAPYTIVTFPFLFAVMFGDIGHGIIMTLFAYVLIHREVKFEREQKEATKPNEIFDILFAGRYIILLMGLFSIYTGFIYNDMLSKSLNIFGSSWQVNFTEKDVINNKHLQLDPARGDNYLGSPYLIGLDPIWTAISDNDIIISNSLKMKMAVILGITQMIFGLLLSAWNNILTKNKVDLYLVFLPQIVFFCCLFLYLIILIFYKWYCYGGHNMLEFNSGCAPSILIIFINMMLMKKSDEPSEDCKKYLYEQQPFVQNILLTAALISVPVLLCGKPIHFMVQSKRIKKMKDPTLKALARRATSEGIRKSLIYVVEFDESLTSPSRSDPSENLSEVWIHQGIHTIESILGSISHTASYLRLWALSLAHSQLSHVLWSMVLTIGLKTDRGYYNIFLIYVSFTFFAILTVAILVVMEGLSAFLHTLRLHWVEFQSKFYSGTGEVFTPFRFAPLKQLESTN